MANLFIVLVQKIEESNKNAIAIADVSAFKSGLSTLCLTKQNMQNTTQSIAANSRQ
jgi:hypothetical protein